MRSLDTDDDKEAARRMAAIDQTLDELARGRVQLPDGADLWEFLRTDGKRTQKLVAPARPTTLADIFEEYFRSQQAKRKEHSSLVTEQLHYRTMLRHFDGSTPVRSIDRAALERYIGERSETVATATVKKEIATLRMLLYWAIAALGVTPASEPRTL